MGSESTVVRRSRLCTFLKALFAIEVLAVIVAGVLVASNFGEGPVPEGSPQGHDLRTYEGMLALAQAGPEVRGSLASFWSSTLKQVDQRVQFVQPSFDGYDEKYPRRKECGEPPEDEGRNNAFYCQPERDSGKPGTIIYDEDYLAALDRLQGRFAPLMTMAHEYGHHISQLRYGWTYIGGATPYSIQEELQADCFAGMYLRHSSQLLGLNFREAALVGQNFFKIGDTTDFGTYWWFEPGRHGTPRERLLALTRGFGLRFGFGLLGTSDAQRFHRCEQYRDYKSEQIAQFGPHRLTVPDADLKPIDRERTRITDADEGVQAHLRYFPPATSPDMTSIFIDDDVSDVRTRPHKLVKQCAWYGFWSARNYERSYVRDGELVHAHGELVLLEFLDGGAIGLDVFQTAPPTDQSWGKIDAYRKDLQDRLILARQVAERSCPK